MTKVTIDTEATPSQKLLAEASAEASFPLPDGRKIVLFKPDILAQTRLAKVLGPELAANQTYMGMIMPLLYVKSIDGEAVPFPQSVREIEALLSRLGDVGYTYVGVGVGEHFPPLDLEAVKTAVKK